MVRYDGEESDLSLNERGDYRWLVLKWRIFYLKMGAFYLSGEKPWFYAGCRRFILLP